MAVNLSVLIFSLCIVCTLAQLSSVDTKKTETIKINNHNKGCGWRNEHGIGFGIALNDNFAGFGEFPWIVAIFSAHNINDTVNNKPQCGGSLIAPNVVLTAAQCATNNGLIVRGGEWDLQTENEILKHVDINVKEMIIHENFNRINGYNDVALLILEDSFVWEENIRPICLPESNVNFDGQRCFVAGWAKFGHEDKYQVILNKIDLPIIPHDNCQNNISQWMSKINFKLHESILCAGGEKNKDICIGGSGSPLFCAMPNEKDRYYQAGIVSKGVGCGLENIPGLYANVSYLRTWILEKLASKKITFNHFTP